MHIGLIGGITAARVVRPEGDALEAVHTAYISAAMAGRATEAQREIFFAAGRRLCAAQGAEAIVLGGTDPFLAFAGHDCEFPLVDCADVHLAALFAQSIGGAAPPPEDTRA